MKAHEEHLKKAIRETKEALREIKKNGFLDLTIEVHEAMPTVSGEEVVVMTYCLGNGPEKVCGKNLHDVVEEYKRRIGWYNEKGGYQELK